MREKSQIDDMRAAVRGDLERARARRDADPWRPQDPETTGDLPPAESSERLKPATAGPVVEPIPTDAAEGLTPKGSVPAEPAEPETAADEPTPAVPAEGLTPKGSVPTETPEPGEPAAAPPPATEPAAQKKSFFARLFGRG
jgi:hypothetical protein